MCASPFQPGAQVCDRIESRNDIKALGHDASRVVSVNGYFETFLATCARTCVSKSPYVPFTHYLPVCNYVISLKNSCERYTGGTNVHTPRVFTPFL